MKVVWEVRDLRLVKRSFLVGLGEVVSKDIEEVEFRSGY